MRAENPFVHKSHYDLPLLFVSNFIPLCLYGQLWAAGICSPDPGQSHSSPETLGPEVKTNFASVSWQWLPALFKKSLALLSAGLGAGTRACLADELDKAKLDRAAGG